MGNWQLEIFKFSLYVFAPVAAFYVYHQVNVIFQISQMFDFFFFIFLDLTHYLANFSLIAVIILCCFRSISSKKIW